MWCSFRGGRGERRTVEMRARDRVTAILAATTLGVALAVLGSAPRWATCVTAGLCLATALPLVLSRRAAAQVSPLIWLLGLAAGLTALQLVPLPAALAELVAPARLALVADNAAALGKEPPGWIALSYDPPATLVELARLVAYVAFAFVCTRLAASSDARRWLAHMVVIAGAAMAVIALGHHVLGMDSLFGIYQPREAASPYMAPLLNENHLAGFLAFTVPLALVLALLAQGGLRVAWLTAALLCAGTTLLTLSRGGALALAAGVVATGVLLLVERRSQAEKRRTRSQARLSVLIPAGVVVACAVVLLATFTAGGVREELAETSADELHDEDSKFGVWRATTHLVADNLWAGVGRGGFEPAFTRVHHSGVKTYSHVENEYLQALVDWGVPGTAALVLVLVWTVILAVRRWDRGPLEIGALSALLAIALHNTVDFNLEMPGVALAAIAVLAILLPVSPRRVPGERRRFHALARGAALALGTAVIAAAASPLGRTAHADGDALAALLRTPDSPPERRIRMGEELLARHPSDYLIAGLTAEAYFHDRDPRAVELMNRALALNPKHPGLHVLAAKMLIAGGRSEQALVEFSLALRYTLEPERILAELIRWFPEPARAARGIPTAAERVPVMTNRLVTMGRSDVALAYARRAAEDNPDTDEILELVSRLALSQGDKALALEAGQRAYADRASAANALALGRALRAADKLAEAASVAEKALESRLAQGESWHVIRLHELLADVRLAQEKYHEARETLRQAIALARGDHRALAGLYRRLASAEEALGHTLQAREARKLAEEHGSY